jgi:hypothetical protein
MTVITTVLIVAADGTISAAVPLPAGEHEARIEVGDRLARPSPPPSFTMEGFPTHDMGWDDRVSLRREDMYGDDGR